MSGVLTGYAEDPARFVRQVIGGEPWDVQESILTAVRDHPRVTVRSCHGVGKSWVAACAALWFLYTREPVTVLTTAPTHRQVKEVLWREIRRLHRRMFTPRDGEIPAGAALRGEIRDTALKLADDRFALGLTTDEPDRFQGFHAPHVLVVVDEASGVDEEIYRAIDGVLTGEEARLLLIGNPLHARGPFYESHRKEGWARFAISAFQAPNVAGRNLDDPGEREQASPMPGLVTARWVWERRRDWGEDSPLWQSRVLGEFPDQASDALIRLSWIHDAVERGRKPEKRGARGLVEMGVDVARFGDCETVACVRRGPRVLLLEAWRHADLMATAERVRQIAARHHPEVIRVDGVGVGGGAVDRLCEVCEGVVDMNAGRAPRDRERFVLLRDELFFGLRDRFRDGDIALPDDPRLVDQRAGLTYSITPRGQQAVESKGDMQGRGLPSPDRADALALAFAPQTSAARPVILSGRPR